ncbi:SDR family oxidoreductase [Streptomyces beijiangensis]|uniref:NmrA family NAD(P)-binding protein n=1 Tax=Streptomyces beijiangensis TaxID=163361 RepID=A0A939JH38_9ACTN|nr:NmrA family NAD(P)-binding protein [Streptomyces beijiangensis]MBO0511745.1 NmrA family NAD(P)-binding protein [Streptomyces beijiangensis]
MTEHTPQRCAVVGATGFQGGAVARLLIERGHRVRTLTRRIPADRPQLAGLSYVSGDLGDRDEVRRLLEGATHASVVMPLSYDPVLIESYARNIGEAARESGVLRIVYNANTRVPAHPTGVAAFETRRLAESVLRESGVDLVVLRPPVYLDNLFSPWNGPALIEDGLLAYPLPTATETAWISHRDLAEATAAALFTEADEVVGRTFDIGGERSLTGEGLAAEFALGLGRSVRYEALPADLFEKGLAQVIGAAAAAGVAGIYHYMATGDDPHLMAGDGGEAARTLGITPRAADAWVATQPWQMWATPESA